MTSLVKPSICDLRYRFSITTILSSTNRPIATAIPPIVITFKLMSDNDKKNKVIASDNGMLIIVISVILQFLKNRKIIKVANNVPSSTSRIILLTEPVMKESLDQTRDVSMSPL
ncbi:hypothetical protein D3C75_715090 [compost metagenome]